jgi:formylglycine-generating enzyme required for sulfatase activity
MVSIPAGTFQMGDTNTAIGATPVHNVSLGAFTISQTLVTQKQYQAVMDTNPAYFDYGGTWPVDMVSWYDAALYCNALSKLAGKDTVYTFTSISGTPGAGCYGLGNININYTKNGYRLPTEAEWEYACRAGTTTDYYWGRNYPPTTSADTLAIDSNAVWYHNSPDSTQPVATKKPNAWGLYDMSGNLWEWCNDWYGSYSDSSQTNPTGATSGIFYVLRGGSWLSLYPANSLCSAYRGYNYVDDLLLRNSDYGFRVVCGAR